MGGPCFLVEKRPDTGKPGPKLKKTPCPACTDNFQIAKFEFESKEWHSVEQAYQGYKFHEETDREKMRLDLPTPGESSHDYGQRMWRLGQQGTPHKTEADGVRLMYRLCAAKLRQHPEMQQDLLATGETAIFGGPSTAQWSKWNGLIQTRLREELRTGETNALGGLAGDDVFKFSTPARPTDVAAAQRNAETLLAALREAEPKLIELGVISAEE
ncbi:unnamed protein product [Amoebophrya sp. A120]|nr:unnamed protein product [Amoebophrya sp. A120]|eukprot:GSA120T00000245001.1